jgi:hypothetical protein
VKKREKVKESDQKEAAAAAAAAAAVPAACRIEYNRIEMNEMKRALIILSNSVVRVRKRLVKEARRAYCRVPAAYIIEINKMKGGLIMSI